MTAAALVGTKKFRVVAKPNAIIVDVDGTLADVSGILHYVKRPRNEKDFDSFHKAAVFAPINEMVAAIIKQANNSGVAVFIVTARMSKWEKPTRQWLAKHGVVYDALCMRKNKDRRKDVEVKREILTIIRQTHTPVMAIDDNPSIIELWESEDIPTVTIEGWQED